jgi:YVTN family beta-propeller protein
MTSTHCRSRTEALATAIRNPFALFAGLFALLVCAGCGGGNNTTTTITDPVPAKIGGTVAVGTAPSAIAVDSTNNKIVVTDFGSPETALGTTQQCQPTGADVTVIDGVTETPAASSFNFPENPSAVVIDLTSHVAYVLGTEYLDIFTGCNGSPSALSGAADTGSQGPIGQLPVLAGAYDVNPQTEKIYLARPALNSVLVLDGTTLVGSTTVPVGTGPGGLSVNTTTNKIYVANKTSNDISIIDGATNSVITIADPAANPSQVAINPVTNKVYVSHSSSNTISVIDGATNAVSTVADPNALNPGPMEVNTTTDKVYVANSDSNNVTLIDGATNSVTTIAVGTSPSGVTVDEQRNFIYVANAGNSQTGDLGSITVIDGKTNAATTLTDPKAKNPVAIAANSVTNKIYVANSGSNNVTVINGAHN